MTPVIKSVELPDKVKLQYAERGDKSGIPVILLHGVSDSWHSFEPVLPHLPKSIHAFALTQRGHGDSGRPANGYHFHNFAADVAGFMDAVNLDKAIIVGHSMGSSVTQRFAIDFPHRTSGIVLIGAFANLCHNQDVQQLWDSVISELTDPVDPAFVQEFQESTLVQPIPREFLQLVVEESLKLPARVWKAVFKGFLEDDFAGHFNKIKAPTLIIWGDRDAYCPRSDQQMLIESISGSELIVYTGAGHTFHWENPKRFASDLIKFTERLREASDSNFSNQKL